MIVKKQKNEILVKIETKKIKKIQKIKKRTKCIDLWTTILYNDFVRW